LACALLGASPGGNDRRTSFGTPENLSKVTGQRISENANMAEAYQKGERMKKLDKETIAAIHRLGKAANPHSNLSNAEKVEAINAGLDVVAKILEK
jgi:hypothetical protein